jgi:hypothetical protein
MINLTERGIDLYYDLIASANQGTNYWQAKKDEGWQSIYHNIDVSKELSLNTTDLYRFIAQLTASEEDV